ncbi:MAG: peptidase M23, partial [Chloroflexaceae bacterium]
MKSFRGSIALLALVLAACVATPPSPTPSPPVTPVAVRSPTPVPPSTATPLPLPSPAMTVVTVVTEPSPGDPLFDPRRLSYAHNFNGPEIQAFLEARGSPLASARFQVGDRSHSFSEVLVGLSSL